LSKRNILCDLQNESTTKQYFPPFKGAPMLVDDYTYFTHYTYTSECALLAYNFTELLREIGVFEYFTPIKDRRTIAVINYCQSDLSIVIRRHEHRND
jgi:hypothetical protein